MSRARRFWTRGAISSVALLAVCIVAYAQPAAAQPGVETYRFERMWPNLPQPWYFASPHGIAVDAAGHVYVVDLYNHRIQKFDGNGGCLSQWGSEGLGNGEFSYPFGVAVDAAGHVYVADTGNHRIQKFDGNGGYLSQWGSWGSGNGEFNTPCAVAVDAGGHVYVADQGNHRVQKFDSNGGYLGQWGSEGLGNGEFSAPRGVTVDAVGHVYVADEGNHRIQKFDGNGGYLSQWGSWGGSGNGQFSLPADVAVDAAGYVYVADMNNHRIQKFDGSGVYLSQWGSGGSRNGQFFNPTGVAVDAERNVYIADWLNDRIQKFSCTGAYLGQWGSEGLGNGEFFAPMGIAVDAAGYVYVADSGNRRIQKFDSNGTYLGQWGSYGSDNGEVFAPIGVAVDVAGDVYVVDSLNHRIQKFRPVVLTENAKAIVVAGGGPYAGNTLWPATQASANFAYWALMTQGFTADEIYYLSADTHLDLTNNGEPDVDAVAAAANLQFALTQWAPAPLNDLPTGDVAVYLVNHGGDGTFRMSATEVVHADELRQWVNALETGIQGRVTLVMDQCQAGSMLPGLAASNRVVIASAGADENAYFLSTGAISFSTFFWTHVFNGLSVLEAYSLAEQALGQAIGFQNPHLADPSNLAATTWFGNGAAHSSARPEIGGVAAAPPALSGGVTAATIRAEPVLSDEDIVRVWAVIRPPDFVIEDPNAPVQNLPSVELWRAAGTDRWEGVYENFTVEGTYHIAVYARNSLLNTSLPKLQTVSVNNPLRRRAVLVAGGTQSGPLWLEVEQAARTAHRALRGQGYPDADIRYYSATATEGVDGLNTKANLANALEDWAASDTQDLVLYLVGDGAPGLFRTNASETVSAGDLAGWLNALQETMPGRITLVYDAPQSGSFIAPLAPPGDRPRTLIASTRADESAEFLAKGDVSFSGYFWRQILSGAALEGAFRYASQAMKFSSGGQEAQLDDTGNGVPNERRDGIASRQYRLGAGIMLAGDPPTVGPVAPEQELESSHTATLWVDHVIATRAVAAAFAVITPPGFSARKALRTGTGRVTLELEPVGSGRFEAEYDGFRSKGTYEIAYFALDTGGNLSLPAESLVVQTEDHPPDAVPGDVNGDGDVDSVDIQLVINAALGLDIGLLNGDVTGDGLVDAVDIQRVINCTLGIAG